MLLDIWHISLSNFLFLVDSLHSLLTSFLFKLPFQSRVVVVLDVVVGPSRKVLGDF
jgi:hypothetical protein